MKSQYSTMPASSTTRLSWSSPQRPRTPGRLSASVEAPRLVAQALSGGVERGNPLHQLRAALDASPLGVLDLAVHLVERLRHRREQILDRLLARVDIAGRFAARFAQTRFGEGKKCLVVGLERVSTQCLKGFAQLALSLIVRPETLRVHGAIFLELGPKTDVVGLEVSGFGAQTRVRWTAHEPSCQGAGCGADDQCRENRDLFDGH